MLWWDIGLEFLSMVGLYLKGSHGSYGFLLYCSHMVLLDTLVWETRMPRIVRPSITFTGCTCWRRIIHACRGNFSNTVVLLVVFRLFGSIRRATLDLVNTQRRE